MGIETEFGIAVVGSDAEVNPVVASSLVVGARRTGNDIVWDYSDEQPLRDAREEVDAHEPPLVDDMGLANTVLDNGARFYVDHAHPEYATPEVTTARDAVVHDRAGQVIVQEAADRATARLPAGGRILIHKNNTDGKGAAYGAHENHLVSRAVPFGAIVEHLTPLFVSRSLYAGIGRIGGEHGHRGVPTVPTRRLLRDAGRPGDHAAASDHQHPRRAPRRSRDLPTTPRHHR